MLQSLLVKSSGNFECHDHHIGLASITPRAAYGPKMVLVQLRMESTYHLRGAPIHHISSPLRM